MISMVFCQEIPQDFIEYFEYEVGFDYNKNWDKKSNLGPIRYDKNYKNKSDSLKVNYRVGFENKYNLKNENNLNLYGYYHFSYKENFYGYLYSRIASNSESLSRYTGKPREISRFGLNSGEVDLSGIGYENDWLILQIGRGRQNWGAVRGLDLALGEGSAPYDYGLFALNLGKLRGKYFHGFLENHESSNRYIVGHGIEYSNLKNLVLSLSEVVIYSGIGRPLDLSYFNPFFSHLEIELNNRSNSSGVTTGGGNAIWMQSIDWFVHPKFRLSANFLIDELAIDKIERDNGKEHSLASAVRFAITPNIFNYQYFVFYFQYKKIGSYALRHHRGSNNFVHRGLPLGSELGSDLIELKFGLNYYNQSNFFIESNFSLKSTGEESIIYRPYDPYLDTKSGPFPSGQVIDILSFSMISSYRFKTNIAISSEFEFQKSESFNDRLSMIIGINIYCPLI